MLANPIFIDTELGSCLGWILGSSLLRENRCQRLRLRNAFLGIYRRGNNYKIPTLPQTQKLLFSIPFGSPFLTLPDRRFGYCEK